jgi:peptide/nickel transport system substrate-binding protein
MLITQIKQRKKTTALMLVILAVIVAGLAAFAGPEPVISGLKVSWVSPYTWESCLTAVAGKEAVTVVEPVSTLRVGLPDVASGTFVATYPFPSTRFIGGAVFRGLVAENDEGDLVAALAEEVPTLANGQARFITDETGKEQLAVAFRLREGLTWSDGQPITAEDVRFTYEFLQQEGAVLRGQTAVIERVETPDARTAVFVYKAGLQPLRYNEPLAGLLYPAHVMAGITPDEAEASPLAVRPVASGPYQVAAWCVAGDPELDPVRGDSIVVPAKEMEPALQYIVLEPNPAYFGASPVIERLVIEVIPDPELLLKRIREGELDLLPTSAGQDHSLLAEAATAGLSLAQSYDQGWMRLDFNALEGPTSEAAVRQAIAHAIDREALVSPVFGSYGRRADSWVSPGSWAYLPATADYAYDPGRARALLAEAGYLPDEEGYAARDGARLAIELFFIDGREIDKQAAELIRDNLTAVGIEIHERPVYRGAIFGAGGILERRLFEMVLYGWRGEREPNGFRLWHSSQIPSLDNRLRGDNYAGWQNEENDALLELLAGPATRQEQIAWLHRQQELYAEDLPSLPLFEFPKFALHSPDLEGLNLPPGLTPATWNVEAWRLSR